MKKIILLIILFGVNVFSVLPASAATKFIRANTEDKVYIVSNGVRVLIPGPSVFEGSGYSWRNLRVVSKAYLEKVPLAKAVKTANSDLWYIIQPGSEAAVKGTDYLNKFPSQKMPVAEVSQAYIDYLVQVFPDAYSKTVSIETVANTTVSEPVATAVKNTAPVGTITILESPFTGVVNTGPGGLNNLGQTVGSAFAKLSAHGGSPVFWNANAKGAVAGTKGSFGRAIDINDSGTIIGNISYTDDGEVNPFVYENNKLNRLRFEGRAQSINKSGTVVGEYFPNEFLGKGFIYKKGVVTKVPYSLYSINDANVAVGILHNEKNDLYEGVIWDGKKLTKLFYEEGTMVHPNSINNKGQILGTIQPTNPLTSSIKSSRFIWEKGVFTLIDSQDYLFRMNDLGQAISSGSVWQDGVEVAVNEFIPVDSEYKINGIVDINNASQILASCFSNNEHSTKACVVQLPTNIKEFINSK